MSNDILFTFIDKQERINGVLNDRSKALITESEKNKTLCEFNHEQLDKFSNQINILTDKQNNIVSFDDLLQIKEVVNLKAAHTDLHNLYELKLNKSDIKAVLTSMDNIHKQITYTSIFNLSIIKLIKDTIKLSEQDRS